ncbi:enoyl-CoA hydratase/isomerase family protein [Nocardioides sp. GXZ039]|uniref:enoyl-CoA hydratase/isomerase family protein n=1 Tax=Nocardioides sp. GXZ039 TaxID=3136018 RepID=UPI0030F49C3A
MTSDLPRYRSLRFTRTKHVGRLVLARANRLNAMSSSMLGELRDLGGRLLADRDSALRCLVVSGDGRSFSTGLDLTEFSGGVIAELATRPSPDSMIGDGLDLAGSFEWLPRLPYPSIAAVRGHAYGGGFQLALACDLRVFARDALVGLTESRFGLVPDMGATFRLPRIVAPGVARELILLGEIIDGERAYQIGLANRVVDADELDGAVQELAEKVVGQSPTAVAAARRLLRGEGEEEARLLAAVREQAHCLRSEHFREALRALADVEPR